MFGYVNLMIIKLLMMKLHAQVIYIYICMYVYFVFCSKLVKYDALVDGLLMNSFLIAVVVVMRCCC